MQIYFGKDHEKKDNFTFSVREKRGSRFFLSLKKFRSVSISLLIWSSRHNVSKKGENSAKTNAHVSARLSDVQKLKYFSFLKNFCIPFLEPRTGVSSPSTWETNLKRKCWFHLLITRATTYLEIVLFSNFVALLSSFKQLCCLKRSHLLTLWRRNGSDHPSAPHRNSCWGLPLLVGCRIYSH